MSVLTKWNPFRPSSETEAFGPLARREPFRDMERSFNRLERLFGRGGNGDREAMTIAEWAPLVDISEDEKEFVVKAELPEVKKEDVKVTREDGVLTIRGERKAEKEEKGKKFHRIERSYGSFERSFTLPETADASKITSEFKDGMLTVHLPKNANAKPNAVEIKVQ
jgi:HSP20 family protein